jgi:hypothetical protein
MVMSNGDRSLTPESKFKGDKWPVICGETGFHWLIKQESLLWGYVD